LFYTYLSYNQDMKLSTYAKKIGVSDKTG
jgi:hypothetical protein